MFFMSLALQKTKGMESMWTNISGDGDLVSFIPEKKRRTDIVIYYVNDGEKHNRNLNVHNKINIVQRYTWYVWQIDRNVYKMTKIYH